MNLSRRIPKNATCLHLSDYAPYFRSWLPQGAVAPEALEAVWQELIPDRRLIPAPSGRHSLWLFLQAARLPPGSEVLISAYNFYVVVQVIAQLGLRPVFVDVEPDTLCMSLADLASKITPRSRLVIVTHMFGHAADIPGIQRACRERSLLLFEDCAHAVGTRVAGRQVGRFGDGALFSFGVEKLVNSFGGGMLAVTEEFRSRCLDQGDGNGTPRRGFALSRCLVTGMCDPAAYGWSYWPLENAARFLARRGVAGPLTALRPERNDVHYRFDPGSHPPFAPFMLEMQRQQLERLTENVTRRRARWVALSERLREFGGVRLFAADKHGSSNAAYAAVSTDEPTYLSSALRQAGIDSHPQEFLDCSSLQQFAAFASACPEARRAEARTLRLPSYPKLRSADVARIASVLARALQARGTA